MHFHELLTLLDHDLPCVWVSVAGVRGSAPREEGAGMVVAGSTVAGTTVAGTTVRGTIGGGHLELKAIELAREWLRLGKTSAMQRHYPLGPALGQCCGGAVDLLFRPITMQERPWVEALVQAEKIGGNIMLRTRPDTDSPHTTLDAGAVSNTIVTRHAFHPWHVWIFGAGHVGKALVQVFGTLPCVLTWVDSRDAEFPPAAGHHVRVLQSDHPAGEVTDIPSGADVLVLTHSHALDLDIVTQLLRRNDLAYLGLIGSQTKAQLFHRRLAARGLDAARMVCPIGAITAGKKDKHPGAIAVSVAADLLARRAARSALSDQTVAHA